MIGRVALRFAAMLCMQALFILLMLGATRAILPPSQLSYFIEKNVLSRSYYKLPTAETDAADQDQDAMRRERDLRIERYGTEAKNALHNATLLVAAAGTLFAAAWLVWVATQRWHGAVLPASLKWAWFGTLAGGALVTGAWLRFETLAPDMRLIDTDTWCWIFLCFFAVFTLSFWVFGTLVGAWHDVKPAVPLARHLP